MRSVLIVCASTFEIFVRHTWMRVSRKFASCFECWECQIRLRGIVSEIVLKISVADQNLTKLKEHLKSEKYSEIVVLQLPQIQEILNTLARQFQAKYQNMGNIKL